jgi:hypothetical protein
MKCLKCKTNKQSNLQFKGEQRNKRKNYLMPWIVVNRNQKHKLTITQYFWISNTIRYTNRIRRSNHSYFDVIFDFAYIQLILVLLVSWFE